MNKLMILTACLFISLASFAQPETNFHVSTKGSDRNPGTLEKPFATGLKALEAITKLKATTGKTDVTVHFHEGIYYGASTLNVSGKFSGGENSLVTFKTYEEGEVIFHGGKKLNGSIFKPCKDKKILERLLPEARDKVWVADLWKAGVTDFGTLKQHGFGTVPEPAPLELFINGEPQWLARYPNEGKLQIGKIYDKGSVPRVGDHSGRGAEFGYEYERVERWAQADEVWLHGKFSYGYNDDHLKVENIDTDKKSIKIAQPHLYGVYSNIYDESGELLKAPSTFRGYYAYNLLEEIDQPGEYFLDRKTGKLYIYPESSLAGAEIEVSLMETPFFSFENTSHVRVEGITFTCARGLGIYMKNCQNITIDNCIFSNLGTVAISMGQPYSNNKKEFYADGSPSLEQQIPGDFKQVTVSNCLIFNTGTGGIVLDGGDRKKLIPGNNMVFNTELYRIDRINNTYSPAIKLNGVGNIVRNCYFHDLRHQAISFMGNDHIIEYSRFDKVCTDADDSGAIYTGRDPSSRGTVIQYNYFSNIEPDDKKASMSGIYFDDGSGGMTVKNNFFYKVGNPGHYVNFSAVFFHGGHDNTVADNIFMDCEVAVGATPWNDERWKSGLEKPLIKERLLSNVDIMSDAYQNRYPELKDYFTKIGRRLNTVKGNLLIRSKIAINGDFLFRRNITLDEIGDSPDEIDYQQAKKLLQGIKPFPFEKCGILNDEK